MSEPSHKIKRVPRAERERQMLEAAARLFGEKGYDATSMDDIANACGITKPMVYAYFESKEGLYASMLNRAGIRLLSNFAEAVVPGNPRESISNTSRAFLDFVGKYRGSWRMIFSELPHQARLPQQGDSTTILAYRMQFMKGLTHLLVRIPQGCGKGPDSLARAEPFAYAWLGACEQVAQWWLASPDRTKQDAEEVLSQLREGYLATIEKYLY